MKHKFFLRSILAAASLTALTLLSGCTLSALSAENVMAPPQAFGDGAAIQSALEDALGPQITLCYPRSGEHRSAVVRSDVDSDDQEEAIVFYRLATESSGAHMALLDIDENDKWTMVGEFSGAEGEIDRIMFGDIDGDEATDIITGWSVHSDYGVLYVHSCANDRLNTLTITSNKTETQSFSSYAEVAVGDFDGDSADELLTVCLPGDKTSGEARLLKWNEPPLPGGSGSIRPISTLTLTPGVQNYTGCIAGHLSWNTYGLVVDSLRSDGSYFSELIIWDKAQRMLFSPTDPQRPGIFCRTLSTASADINGDGYIEIPGDSLLPGCSAPGARKVYLTDWYRYSNEAYVRVFGAIMRTDNGYYFTMPDSWLGKVTAQPDTSTHTLHMYLADGSDPFSVELMCIKVFTMDEWEEELSSGWNETPTEYQELCTTDYYVYAVSIPESNTSIAVDYETVIGCFVPLV